MLQINWEIAATIGEWIGAVAVIVTVFYMAVQVRYSNRDARVLPVTEKADIGLIGGTMSCGQKLNEVYCRLLGVILGSFEIPLLVILRPMS